VSKVTYVAIGIRIYILVFKIVIGNISFKLYKQNKLSMDYIKALVTTRSVYDIWGVVVH